MSLMLIWPLGPFLLLSLPLKWCLMLKYDLREAEWS